MAMPDSLILQKQNIDINKCYRLLLNNLPHVVEKHIIENAANVEDSLAQLNLVLEIKEIFPALDKKEMSWTDAFFQWHLLQEEKSRGNKLPPIPRLHLRLKNLSKAIYRFVLYGMPVVSRIIAEKRVAICEENKCGFFDGSICRHKNCGCFTRVKSFLTTEHCPVGYW